MLFHSPEYIAVFFPIVVSIYFFLMKTEKSLVGKIWLILASLAFYGYWATAQFPIILFSVFFNFAIGQLCENGKHKASRTQYYWILFGVIVNLSLLGYFKYKNFVLHNLNNLFSSGFQLEKLILPLAISFFTFQQIGYLLDRYHGRIKNSNFIDYFLFVCFFPQFIVGPIVFYSELIPQFQDKRNFRINKNNMILGVKAFAIGLVKKVYVADVIADITSHLLLNPNHATTIEAWVLSAAFAVQVYFDFSSYSDMAIGSALFFNIRLPMNFNSPFQAKSMDQLWRTWHITFHRVLLDFIYKPIVSSRYFHPSLVFFLALFMFFMAGLWHGANWNYALFGVAHGFGWIVCRMWQQYGFVLPEWISHILVFVWSSITSIIFRPASLITSVTLYSKMFAFDKEGPLKIINIFPDMPFFTLNGVGTTQGDLLSPINVLFFILVFSMTLMAPNSMELIGFVERRKHTLFCRIQRIFEKGLVSCGLSVEKFYSIVYGMGFGFAFLKVISMSPQEFFYFNF